MELAFVLLFVLMGTGAIVYAGLRQPPARPAEDAEAPQGHVAPGGDEGESDGGAGAP